MSLVHKVDIRVGLSDWRDFSLLMCVCVINIVVAWNKNHFPAHMHMEVAIIYVGWNCIWPYPLRVVVKNDSFVAWTIAQNYSKWLHQYYNVARALLLVKIVEKKIRLFNNCAPCARARVHVYNFISILNLHMNCTRDAMIRDIRDTAAISPARCWSVPKSHQLFRLFACLYALFIC